MSTDHERVSTAELAANGPSGIPHVVQTAWGLNPQGTRGPRRGLTVDRIIETAVELADAEGLPAVSMARVAKELGFTTMSLYRYVESKDDLVELMLDRALGAPPESDPELDWRAAIERSAVAEFAAVSRHPWWLDVPMGAPSGPNNLAWLEHLLRCLEPTGLGAAVKVSVALNISMYVVGHARLSKDIAGAADNPAAIDYATVLPTLLDPTRFPALLAAVHAGAFGGVGSDDDEDEDHFLFGLERLLDGIAVFVESTAGGATRDVP